MGCKCGNLDLLVQISGSYVGFEDIGHTDIGCQILGVLIMGSTDIGRHMYSQICIKSPNIQYPAVIITHFSIFIIICQI